MHRRKVDSMLGRPCAGYCLLLEARLKAQAQYTVRTRLSRSARVLIFGAQKRHHAPSLQCLMLCSGANWAPLCVMLLEDHNQLL